MTDHEDAEQVERSDGPQGQWFTVRRVIQHSPGSFEERITLWLASSFDDAIERSEVEAVSYAQDIDADEDLGLGQCYLLDADAGFDPTSSGSEIFSLIRDVPMDADTYIHTYFVTGREHEQS